MVSSSTPGREPVQIVEIVQPLCANVYGASPCTAARGAGLECFNTRGTCQDVANYDGSNTLSLFFTKGNQAERSIVGVPYAIPSLVSVSTVPTRINLTAANPDAKGLGNRATASVVFQDHPHTDRRVDPYVDGRAYAPLQRGSFWSKWFVRNKFRYSLIMRIYEGYAGQALADMSSREYILTNFSGPDDSGRVRIQGKDVLAKIEERKAQAPKASPGELLNAITSTQTTIPCGNALTTDYPAAGTLRIDDEIITYSSQGTTGAGTISFYGCVRGSDGTAAAAHAQDKTVQECLRYVAEPVTNIVDDLLINWGGIASANVDSGVTFAEEASRHLSAYNLTALITSPIGVDQLLSELQEQVGFFVWWDERVALVKLRAIRGLEVTPQLLSDDDHIIEGSVNFEDLPRSRVSQLWFYYNLNNPALSLDAKNFATVKVVADLGSEGPDQYGEQSIRKIFSRWIQSGSLAFTSAFKIVNRYATVPQQATFTLDAKDRNLWTGDAVYISHHLDVDEQGARRIQQWVIISAEEVVAGERVQYLAENTELYGKVYKWMASDAGDYPGAAAVNFGDAYWGDASGLLSDGAGCATWG